MIERRRLSVNQQTHIGAQHIIVWDNRVMSDPAATSSIVIGARIEVELLGGRRPASPRDGHSAAPALLIAENAFKLHEDSGGGAHQPVAG